MTDVDGGLVSALRVFHRQLSMPFGPVVVGGIGEVSTREEWRGQGLAGRLLCDAMAYMAKQGLALALLHTSRADLASFYCRHGFASVPMQRHILPISVCARITASDAARLLPCSDSLKELAQLYDQWAAIMAPGCIVRSAVYWSQWLQPFLVQDTSISLWRTPLAYMVVRVRTDGPTLFVNAMQVCEFVCCADMSTASFQLDTLLAAAIADYPGVDRLILPSAYAELSRTFKRVTCSTAVVDVVPAAWSACTLGTTLSLQVKDTGYLLMDNGWMVRVADGPMAAACLDMPLLKDERFSDAQRTSAARDYLVDAKFTFLALDNF